MACHCNKTEMFRFETARFVVRAVIVPDADLDLSWDDSGETRENVESGLWEGFGTIVTVSTREGIELGKSSLWGSIYEQPRDFFREHIGLAARSRADGKNYGCYFPQLVREAIDEARKAIQGMPEVRA